jgi:hypothetical protein
LSILLAVLSSQVWFSGSGEIPLHYRTKSGKIRALLERWSLCPLAGVSPVVSLDVLVSLPFSKVLGSHYHRTKRQAFLLPIQ